MKIGLFQYMVILLMPCSVLIFAMDDAAAIKQLGLLYDKGNASLQIADINNALTNFKLVMDTKISNPRFEEFSLKIRAAEKIVEIYQRLNDLQHVQKYIAYVTKNYEDAFNSLDRKGDYEHALMLAHILYDLYNNGKYTSISGQQYELPLARGDINKYVQTQNINFYSKYINEALLMPYKKGVGILADSALKKNGEKKGLEKQAFDLFVEAEKNNPALFKLQHQLALMYKDGIGTEKNLITAQVYAIKALSSAQNTDEKNSAQELSDLIKVDQTINQSKKIEAKDYADRGFEKLRQFQNPPQGSSVEGFDQEALILLGKASLLDPNNLDVEFKLAEMYLKGIGTKPNGIPDPVSAHQHAKQALKIATAQGVDEFIKRAEELISYIIKARKSLLEQKIIEKSKEPAVKDVEEPEETISKRKSITFVTSFDDSRTRSASSSSSSSGDDKRKSVFDIFKKDKDTDK